MISQGVHPSTQRAVGGVALGAPAAPPRRPASTPWFTLVGDLTTRLLSVVATAGTGAESLDVPRLAKAASPFPRTLRDLEHLAQEALHGKLAVECGAVGSTRAVVTHYLQLARTVAAAPLGLDVPALIAVLTAIHGQVRLAAGHFFPFIILFAFL